jgi:serine/threonine-protein kinase
MVDAPLEPSPEVPAPVKPRASRVHRAPGFYSIDSKPYAIIFVDGKRIDQTPLFHISLSAGHHKIRAVLADGRARTLVVRIDPGKDVTSGTLRW